MHLSSTKLFSNLLDITNYGRSHHAYEIDTTPDSTVSFVNKVFLIDNLFDTVPVLVGQVIVVERIL